VRLLTNNPLKVKGLEDAGVKVTERVAHWVGENQHNASYLAVKRRKMGHHPDLDSEPAAPLKAVHKR
jgi:GTP cyclohydrolase II